MYPQSMHVATTYAWLPAATTGDTKRTAGCVHPAVASAGLEVKVVPLAAFVLEGVLVVVVVVNS